MNSLTKHRRGAARKLVELKQLSKTPDSVLARLLGRPLTAIRRRRRQAGVPAFSRFVAWNAVQIALLGKLSDDEVAVRTGRSVRAVSQKRVQMRLAPANPKRRLPPFKTLPVKHASR